MQRDLTNTAYDGGAADGAEGRSPKPQVVIVGAGFGGLDAARALRDAPVDITLLDRHNYHCFQPLLYQSPPQRFRPPTSRGRSAPYFAGSGTSRF